MGSEGNQKPPTCLNEMALQSLGEIRCWGAFSTDTSLKITAWNDWLEESSGIPASQAVGRPLFELYPDLIARRIERYYRQALEGQMLMLSQRLHKYLIPLPPTVPGSKLAQMQQSAHIVPLMEGERIVGTLTVIEDVTERVVHETELRARARQQTAIAKLGRQALAGMELSELFASLALAVTGALDARIVRVTELDGEGANLQVRQIHGGPPPEGDDSPAAEMSPLARHVAKSKTLLVIPDFAAEPAHAPPALPDVEIGSAIALPIVASDRTMGVLEVYLSPENPLGEEDVAFVQSLVNLLVMAVERRTLEEELRHHVAQLADADRRKDEFLAMLAHELRNPLAPIRHALPLLKSGVLDKDSHNEAINVVNRQVDHMVRLVDDLLDVSRILRGTIDLKKEPVELATIINRAVETSQPLIYAQSHQLSMSLPPEPVWLLADSVRMAQVLANLLNNAAKYTDPNGEIRITAERVPEGVNIRISDTGIGIPPELLSRVFDIFTQVDQSIARAQGGLGIGLTLVKSLVEMHGGKVTASSGGLGQGSEFTVWLPVIEHQPESQISPLQPRETRTLRILVVEDIPGSAKMLATLLKRFWKHDVRLAFEGHSALEIAREFRPELVLLDIGLPGMSGFEVAEQMRHIPGMSDSLLVALSGYGQSAHRERGREAGFDEHLVKPASVDDLQKLFEHPKLSR